MSGARQTSITARHAEITRRSSCFLKEVQREAHKVVGLFQMGRMTTLLEYHQIRARDGLPIEGAAFHGDDVILPPPDNGGGAVTLASRCGRRGSCMYGFQVDWLFRDASRQGVPIMTGIGSRCCVPVVVLSAHLVEVIQPRGIPAGDLRLLLVRYPLQNALDDRAGVRKGGLCMRIV